MIQRFEVGETAIFDNTHIHQFKYLIGTEVTILEIITDRYVHYLTCEPVVGYIVDIKVNGENSCCADNNLRKKKPPKESASWEELQKITKWQPDKIKELV